MDTIAEFVPDTGCWLWHSWKTVGAEDKSVVYKECKSCSARRIEKHSESATSIDYEWLMDEKQKVELS